MGLGIRRWRCVGLRVGMGGFRDQEVEMCRFKGGDGWVRDQGVEMCRFNGGDGWV